MVGHTTRSFQERKVKTTYLIFTVLNASLAGVSLALGDMCMTSFNVVCMMLCFVGWRIRVNDKES